MFSCEFCEIFRYTFFTEHLRTTASVRSYGESLIQNCYYSVQIIILFKSIDCPSNTFLEFCNSPFCFYDSG